MQKNKSQLQSSKKKCKSTKIIQYRLIHAQINNAFNRTPPPKKKKTPKFLIVTQNGSNVQNPCEPSQNVKTCLANIKNMIYTNIGKNKHAHYFFVHIGSKNRKSATTLQINDLFSRKMGRESRL